MKKIDKYEVNENYYYDPETHFWVELSGDEARIGMSPVIQETNGSFVAIIMNQKGDLVSRGESFGSAEAEKHVGPLYAPLSGEIIEVNEEVKENPRLINTDPYGKGWLLKIRLSAKDQELSELIYGNDEVMKWFKAELKKFDEKGWIVQ